MLRVTHIANFVENLILRTIQGVAKLLDIKCQVVLQHSNKLNTECQVTFAPHCVCVCVCVCVCARARGGAVG